jgi:hypothetical protein
MGSKAESITETMVTRNSYDVDAVSGATLSSEAIKSAVSKALKKAAGNEYAMRQASGCVMIMVFSPRHARGRFTATGGNSTEPAVVGSCSDYWSYVVHYMQRIMLY